MKKGFSLAEVLITLTIIGVVATVTLPTLNNNIWKGQRGPLVKSSYSRLKNATDIAIQQLGYTPECAYYRPGQNPYYDKLGITTEVTYDKEGNPTWKFLDKNGDEYDLQGKNVNGKFDNCEILGNAILANLRVVKKCNGTGTCKPEYNGIEKVHLNKNSDKFTNATEEEKNIEGNKASGGLSGYRTSSLASNYAFHTANNFTIINYHNTEYFYPSIFAIDVNGNKGPNKWGQDLFSFTMHYARNGKNLEITPDSNSLYEENYNGIDGISAAEILKNRK